MSLTSELLAKRDRLSGADASLQSSVNVRARRRVRGGQAVHIPNSKAATSSIRRDPRQALAALVQRSGEAPVNSPDTQACGHVHRTFTDGAVSIILENLRAGNYVSVAARAAGVTPDGLRMYVLAHPELADQMSIAKAEAETRALDAINSSDSWQAQAFKLERRFPARWGKIDRKVVSGPDGGPIKHQVAVLQVSAEDYQRARSIANGGAISIPALKAGAVAPELDVSDDEDLEEVSSLPIGLANEAGRTHTQ